MQEHEPSGLMNLSSVLQRRFEPPKGVLGADGKVLPVWQPDQEEGGPRAEGLGVLPSPPSWYLAASAPGLSFFRL